MTDFTDLISQAKKMQDKMKETQDALKKIEVEGLSGGDAVSVVMNGDGELKKIIFSNDATYSPLSLFLITKEDLSDNKEEISNLYKDYNLNHIKTKYVGTKAEDRGKVRVELLITNFQIKEQGELF